MMQMRSECAAVALSRSYRRVCSTLVHVSQQEGVLILARTHHVSSLTAVSVGVELGFLQCILTLMSLYKAGCSGGFYVDASTWTVSAQLHCLSAASAQVRSVEEWDTATCKALRKMVLGKQVSESLQEWRLIGHIQTCVIEFTCTPCDDVSTRSRVWSNPALRLDGCTACAAAA